MFRITSYNVCYTKLLRPAGFYVCTKYQPDISIIYTTGVPGKGGHKYWRDLGIGLKVPLPKSLDDFHTLLWTCVPGKEAIIV